MLPLYRFGDRALPGSADLITAHPGLLFDKFVDAWGPNWFLGDKAKENFYVSAAGRPPSDELQNNLAAALQRQRHLAAALGEVDPIDVATDWRFVSGLGMGHPFEAGFIWHRTLAVPYLPGSSVKGLARVWAEQYGQAADQEETDRLFGPRGAAAREEPAAGTLIVFDALPLVVPKLDVDIMNPQYGPYYANREKPPADYYSPTPIFFLTVAGGQPFRFSLAPRPGAYVGGKEGSKASDLQRGRDLLKNALETIGAGGKTAVGYGRFTAPGVSSAISSQGRENMALSPNVPERSDPASARLREHEQPPSLWTRMQQQDSKGIKPR